MSDTSENTTLTPDKLALLQQLVDKANLQERAGRGNQKIRYIDKEYVSECLDAVFGMENWSRRTTMIEKISEGEVTAKARDGTATLQYVISVMAHVELTVHVGARTIVRGGTGVDTNNTEVGETKPATAKGDAMATAYKAAESDAFKRAAASLGYLLGRNIDQKGQTKVVLSGAEPAGDTGRSPEPQRTPTTAAAPTRPAPALREVPKDPAPRETSKPADAAKATERTATPAPQAKPAAAANANGNDPVQAMLAHLPNVRKRPTVPKPADGGNVKVLQNYLQGLFVQARDAVGADDLHDTIALIAEQRGTCAADDSYRKWYNYTAEQAENTAGTLAPDLVGPARSILLPKDDAKSA